MLIFDILFVGIGGIFGSSLRYLISHYVKHYLQKSVSVATFSVNIIGCFLMGLSITLLPLNGIESILFCTGFVSSFTTFSTFISEIHEMHKKRQYLYYILYMILTVSLGFFAIFIGISLPQINAI